MKKSISTAQNRYLAKKNIPSMGLVHLPTWKPYNQANVGYIYHSPWMVWVIVQEPLWLNSLLAFIRYNSPSHPCIQNQQHHFITLQKLVYTGHYMPPNNAHIKGKSPQNHNNIGIVWFPLDREFVMIGSQYPWNMKSDFPCLKRLQMWVFQKWPPVESPYSQPQKLTSKNSWQLHPQKQQTQYSLLVALCHTRTSLPRGGMDRW